MRTLGSVCEEKGGFGPGFDLLRITLALLVMTFHVSMQLDQDDAWHKQPYWVIEYSILPMFFALSGFLISASAMRLSLWQFLLNRGLRIVPALLVEILLSAFVIGPLFTILPWRAYFSDPMFFHYFTNIVGLINYQLPGLFHEECGDVWLVNVSLWTIPYEILCYLLMTLIIVFHLLRRPFPLVILILILTIAPAAIEQAGFKEHFQHIPVIGWWLFGRGHFLLPAFLMGALFYAMRYRIPFHFGIFIASVLMLASVSIGFKQTTIMYTYNLSLPVSIILCYVMVYVGMSQIPKLPIVSRGDYSYGLYLYHSPIINCVYTFTRWNQSTPMLFALCLLPVALFAAFSWHFIEKPILQLRKKFSFVGKRLGH
jgi:peptidoglycan/LPS O-acetylase OafA/YrhL